MTNNLRVHLYSLVSNIIDEDRGHCDYQFSNDYSELYTASQKLLAPWKIYRETDDICLSYTVDSVVKEQK